MVGVAKSHRALLSEYGDSSETLNSKKLLEIYKRELFLSFQVHTPYYIHQIVKRMEVPLRKWQVIPPTISVGLRTVHGFHGDWVASSASCLWCNPSYHCLYSIVENRVTL